MLKMNDKQRDCWCKYMEGLTYKQISEETGLSVHTLKGYQKKFKWNRNQEGTSNGKNTVGKGKNTLELYEQIRGGLIKQLEKNGNTELHFIDLVDDYMQMWDIKNKLQDDIKLRGVQVAYKNGANQFGMKKNDSVGDVIKYNAQMLNLLEKLGLKEIALNGGDDDVTL